MNQIYTATAITGFINPTIAAIIDAVKFENLEECKRLIDDGADVHYDIQKVMDS